MGRGNRSGCQGRNCQAQAPVLGPGDVPLMAEVIPAQEPKDTKFKIPWMIPVEEVPKA